MTSSSDNARREALIAEIAAAFSGVSREGGITLHEADAIDGCADEIGRAKARANDREESWQDVPGSSMERFNAFVFMDWKGYRYYLPAFMTWSVENPCGEAIDCVIASLSPLFGFVFDDRYEYLNPAQCRAVAHFLQYVSDLIPSTGDDAQNALDKIWGKFL